MCAGKKAEENVIILDDLPEFTKAMKRMLLLDGINIKVFEKPEDFLKFTELVNFSFCEILIVDYSMPNLSGFDVYKALKETYVEGLPSKLILYTANLEQIPENEKQFMSEMGVEFMKKPNNVKLMDIITERLENF